MADVTNTFYSGDADIGYGSEFLVGQGDSSPETFAALADVVEVNLGGFTAEIIDKTHLRSPGRAREKMVGLSDFENITVRCNYRPTHGSQKEAGGDGFDATHNMIALNKSLAENNFMALIGSESPREEVPIRGVVSGMTRPTIGVTGKLEVTFTITPLSDYR
jgi:hypothetical protein